MNPTSFQIPASLFGLWRYLHAAYGEPSFVRSCPPDAEIVLHWADRPDTPQLLSGEERSALTRREEGSAHDGDDASPAAVARFSFDVPAVAVPVTLG